MTSEILTNRLRRELMNLERDPPPGISCYPKEDNLTDMEAYIRGPPDSPYENGLFKLDIQIPDNYPFDPPQIRFITKVYHPNIDDAGRICADILKKGEKGGWKPSLNISSTLISLGQLLAHPNPDDPLDADIARQYQLDYPTFEQTAVEYTQKYANEDMAAEAELTNNNKFNEKVSSDTTIIADSSFITTEHLVDSSMPNKPKPTGLSLSKRNKNNISSKSSVYSKSTSNQLASQTGMEGLSSQPLTSDISSQQRTTLKPLSPVASLPTSTGTVQVGSRQESSPRKSNLLLKGRKQSVKSSSELNNISSQRTTKSSNDDGSSQVEEALSLPESNSQNQKDTEPVLVEDELTASQVVKVVIRSSQTKKIEDQLSSEGSSKYTPITLDEDDLEEDNIEPSNMKAANSTEAASNGAVKVEGSDTEIAILSDIQNTEHTLPSEDRSVYSRLLDKSDSFVYSQPPISSATDSQIDISLFERSSSQQPTVESTPKRTFDHLRHLSSLPDDEDNQGFFNGSNSYPVLHSLQLSKKLKRNSGLSLSKKK